MYDLKTKDHVALILPVSGSGDGDGGTSVYQYQRKSLRRHWNQLPRCQKNLIITGIFAVCVTVLLLLPGEQVISQNSASVRDLGHINIAPFKDEHESTQLQQQQLHPQQESNTENSEKTHDTNDNQLKNLFDESLKQIRPVISNGLDLENKKPNNDDNLMLSEKITSLTLPQPVKANADAAAVDDFINRLENNNNQQVEISSQDFKGPANERQKAVVEAFKHSWSGYKEFAWGHDNLKPISMGSHDWFYLGLTIIDSLDTMYIMDLQEDFEEARNWVDTYLQLDVDRDVNLFEVTIRVLGGLLSAYHLSGDKIFLAKSNTLGNRLMACFNSPSGIPYSDVNLATMKAHSPKWSPDSSTSEVTTIQLEFRDLSRCTGNKIFEEVAEIVNRKVHALEKTDGLVPIFINANTGNFRNFATISLGARGDSYYEYLLKQWLQTGQKANDFLIEDYMTAIDGVIKHLVRKTPKEQHTYIGELINGKDFKPKMDHLTCYLSGTLILGHKKGGMPESHLKLATDLLETCYQTYMKQPTGLAPEITYFNIQDEAESDIYVKTNDAHNLLRPEFIESLYYFYALTGNRTYQDMGWAIFENFEKFTKVKYGYTSINNVKNVLNTRPRDMMESFWLGETLKYFYLLFSDDRNEIDLDKYVFNTEAHLIPIREN